MKKNIGLLFLILISLVSSCSYDYDLYVEKAVRYIITGDLGAITLNDIQQGYICLRKRVQELDKNGNIINDFYFDVTGFNDQGAYFSKNTTLNIKQIRIIYELSTTSTDPIAIKYVLEPFDLQNIAIMPTKVHITEKTPFKRIVLDESLNYQRKIDCQISSFWLNVILPDMKSLGFYSDNIHPLYEHTQVPYYKNTKIEVLDANGSILTNYTFENTSDFSIDLSEKEATSIRFILFTTDSQDRMLTTYSIKKDILLSSNYEDQKIAIDQFTPFERTISDILLQYRQYKIKDNEFRQNAILPDVESWDCFSIKVRAEEYDNNGNLLKTCSNISTLESYWSAAGTYKIKLVYEVSNTSTSPVVYSYLTGPFELDENVLNTTTIALSSNTPFERFNGHL